MLIAQISDLHLRPPGLLYEDVVDATAAVAAAVAAVNRLDPQPDVVLLTGDVVDMGEPAAYALAASLLAGLRAPLLAIPGNHDEREAFRSAFSHHAHLPASGPLHFVAGGYGPVRIVALDVTLPGQHHGDVDDEGLAWLDQVLAMAPERPTLLMMHQPPILCGVPYLDAYRCFGADRLAEVVRRHPQVERVMCGHVHRVMMTRFAGTMLCTAPSTTTAIALQLRADAEPASYVEPPGFLLHHWDEDAGLVTHLMPIGEFEGPYPFG